MSNAYNNKESNNHYPYSMEEYPVDKTQKRSYDLYQVASSIHRITRPIFKEKSPANTQIFSDWIDIIGHHYGRITIPQNISNGVLTITCSSTTAAELQYVSQNIIQKINLYCGRELVKKIKLISSRNQTSFTPKKPVLPKRTLKPVEIKDFAPSPLQEALSRLGGHLLARQKGK